MFICAEMNDVDEPRLRFEVKMFGLGNYLCATLPYTAEKCRTTNENAQSEVATAFAAN